MVDRKTIFRIIIFALLVVWFVLMTTRFFSHNTIAILGLFPDILLLLALALAAYSIGSYIAELLRLDEILPTEDVVISTTLGLGILSFLNMICTVLGILSWWTVSIGLILAIVSGFNRIIGMANQPSYLFGPEDLGDESPSPLSWMQYIVIALWVVALFHFCLMPPAFPETLETTLGEPSQWLLNHSIASEGITKPELFTSTTGLYALALALHGPHLAMLLSGLIGGLTLTMLYSGTRRYCGPVASRSTFLIASSIPVFSYSLLSPGDGLLMVLFQFCAFFCMLRWFDEKRRRWAVTSGLLLGFSLSISVNAIFFLIPMTIAAYIWAFSQKKVVKFLQHLFLASGAVGLVLLPWFILHTVVYKNPLSMLHPLLSLRPISLVHWFENLVAIPLQLTFPDSSATPWRTVGPIFLIFVPFFFVSVRKNPMTWIATALGLATLFLSKPFGVVLEERFVATMLLSITAAMAAHRIAKKGWMTFISISLLYILIAGHIFFSTAAVEELFSSPHRYLLGIENEEQYLQRVVPYYQTARWVNENSNTDDAIISFGKIGKVYFERKLVVAQEDMLTDTVNWISSDEKISTGIAHLQHRGFTHLIINIDGLDGDQEILASIEVVKQNLANRLLFTDESYAVYTLK